MVAPESPVPARRKKIVFASNHCAAKTGFGGYMREILTYLYKTGKYDLALYAAGHPWESSEYQRWPWKVIGTLPNDPRHMEAINRDPGLARAASYGEVLVDKLVEQEKPDALVMVEDIWAMQAWRHKSWWGKFPCVVHTTLDSLPILPMAFEVAKSTPYFFSWADFATKAMNQAGISHAKTLHGSVNSTAFKRLSDDERKEIRKAQNIPLDAYCFGMLSRNQLRKSFPNIIEAYALFKKQNPEIKTRLLFYTHYGEGWNIMELLKEFTINPLEVLATYKCRETGQYFIQPFTGQDIDNPKTGHKKSLITCNVSDGLTEEQVNEWYNILDVYVHAFTSGGQERGIQEAKLAELVTLVTNYSCGQDCCVEEAQSLPLEYAAYREPDTQFIKATTSPTSIVEQLEKFYRMPDAQKREMGSKAREWALSKYSIATIGKQMEELLDSIPYSSYVFSKNTDAKPLGNPNAVVEKNDDARIWVKSLYKGILARDVADDDEGLLYWLSQINSKAPLQNIEDYFRQVAREDIAKSITLDKLLGPESPKDRILITIPKSLGDCMYVTSLLENARKIYADKVIYVATEGKYMEIFTPLQGYVIDKVIPYAPELDDVYRLEGSAGNPKYFEAVIMMHSMTQRLLNYAHNGSDRTEINYSSNSCTK